jgi:hypothetical protein
MAASVDERIEKLPLVCTFEEANKHLRLSRSNAKRLRAQGCYPVPELSPPLDARPRFSGEDILAAVRARSDYGKSKRYLRPTD